MAQFCFHTKPPPREWGSSAVKRSADIQKEPTSIPSAWRRPKGHLRGLCTRADNPLRRVLLLPPSCTAAGGCVCWNWMRLSGSRIPVPRGSLAAFILPCRPPRAPPHTSPSHTPHPSSTRRGPQQAVDVRSSRAPPPGARGPRCAAPSAQQWGSGGFPCTRPPAFGDWPRSPPLPHPRDSLPLPRRETPRLLLPQCAAPTEWKICVSAVKAKRTTVTRWCIAVWCRGLLSDTWGLGGGEGYPGSPGILAAPPPHHHQNNHVNIISTLGTWAPMTRAAHEALYHTCGHYCCTRCQRLIGSTLF